MTLTVMTSPQYFSHDIIDEVISWSNNPQTQFNWSGNLFEYPVSNRSMRANIEDLLNESESRVYLYYHKNKLVGYCEAAYSPQDHSIDMSLVIISPHMRGKGIGRKMMTEVLEDLQLRYTPKRIMLAVESHNASAVALYDSCGFEIEGKMRSAMFNAFNNSYHDLILMSKIY